MSGRRSSPPPEPLGDPLVWNDAHLDSAPRFRVAGGEATVFSARGPDKNGANEDAAALIPCGPDRGVLAVADGLGGQPAGEEASGLALRQLGEAVQAAVRRGDEDLRPAILDGIEAANHEILERGTGSATTLVVAEIQGARLRAYHAGDSLLLVVGQRGRVKLQTVSHSPVGYALESGLLDEHEAMHHEHRHLISNLVGSPDMRIEVGSPIPLAARDSVLLASDGLTDNLHVVEIVDRVRRGPLALAAAELARESLRRMEEPQEGVPSKPDDLTFVLFRRAATRRGGRGST